MCHICSHWWNSWIQIPSSRMNVRIFVLKAQFHKAEAVYFNKIMSETTTHNFFVHCTCIIDVALEVRTLSFLLFALFGFFLPTHLHHPPTHFCLRLRSNFPDNPHPKIFVIARVQMTYCLPVMFDQLILFENLLHLPIANKFKKLCSCTHRSTYKRFTHSASVEMVEPTQKTTNT
jgi:hypothetical protein